MTRAPLAAAGVAGAAVLVAVVAAGAAVGGYAVTSAARPSATATASSVVTTPSVAVEATRPPSPIPTRTQVSPLSSARVTAAITPALRAGALGGDVHGQVVDVSHDAGVYARAATTGVAPASTAKLLTAAAVLSVHQPDDRLATTVRAGTDGDIVLVGGGDPTLTAASPGSAPAYPDAARLSDLAAAVRRSGAPVRRIVVDDALFSGPAVSPDWAPEDVPSDYGSAITAVMTDGGRATPSATIRSSTPDLDAGHSLAAALGHANLTVVRGRAPADARVLGSVRSAPLSELIEQMLHNSDNVIAECLARLVAVATRQPATFTGAAAAVRAVVRTTTGVDAGGGMVDASGLAPRDRLTPAAIVSVLRAAVTTARLRDLITGMPTAGWSGTLTGRYTSASTRAGAGVVRAKTGTLTGVSALAGLVHTRSGSLLAFAFVTNKAGDTVEAEAALDAAVTRLAGCGC